MRANRRHLRLLKKRRTACLFNYQHAVDDVDTLANCSRACCGNPRKWFKQLARSEKISQVDADEQCQDLI